MLDFIGIGSAFNGELGNNSAFIKNGKSLLLIDCGGTVFTTIEKNNFLKDLENIYVVITHTHLDHVGSLGDLIFYNYYILKKNTRIFYPHKETLDSFLKIAGVGQEMYSIGDSISAKINDEYLGEIKIKFRLTTHVKEMKSYGFIISRLEESAYYSGDSSSLDEEIVNKLKTGEIKKIYQDTSGLDFDESPHLSLKKLKKIVPVELRSKVYSMHIDKNVKIDDILKAGFNIVKLYFEK